MYLTDGWYWDQDYASRAWSKRYFEKMKKMPSAMQAADYSAVTTYLKAVKAVGSDDGDKVMAQMKTAKISDMFTKSGVIRPDGRMVYDMYLRQVKTPAESKYPWDYYKTVKTIPGEEALRDQGRNQVRPLEVTAARWFAVARRRARHLPSRATSPLPDRLMEIFGIPHQVMMAQLLLGLVNGSFYAMLSLGLAIIFGLLNVINLSHGALYMMGAFAAWMGLNYFGLNYWIMLGLAPLVIGLFGIVVERTMLRRLYKLDHLYGLLLDDRPVASSFEGLFRSLLMAYPAKSYAVPSALSGATDIGFMVLPNYRAWVVLVSVVICFSTRFVIERTKLGALHLRAGTENPKLVEAFGINVPRLVTLTYGFGVALAAFAGVLAAPMVQVSPLMGSNLIIVVFAVVVIGGLSSILGSIVTGLGLGDRRNDEYFYRRRRQPRSCLSSWRSFYCCDPPAPVPVKRNRL